MVSCSTIRAFTATLACNTQLWHNKCGNKHLVIDDFCASEHVGGICCIDEFDGIREADKVSIHEVMEQQTLSIAKAGLVTSLSTRTSVFGAMNPRGKPKDSVAEQTLLSGPLLSRFDILLPVHDAKSAEADEIISEHILTNHQLHRSSESKVRRASP